MTPSSRPAALRQQPSSGASCSAAGRPLRSLSHLRQGCSGQGNRTHPLGSSRQAAGQTTQAPGGLKRAAGQATWVPRSWRKKAGQATWVPGGWRNAAGQATWVPGRWTRAAGQATWVPGASKRAGRAGNVGSWGLEESSRAGHGGPSRSDVHGSGQSLCRMGPTWPNAAAQQTCSALRLRLPRALLTEAPTCAAVAGRGGAMFAEMLEEDPRLIWHAEAALVATAAAASDACTAAAVRALRQAVQVEGPPPRVQIRLWVHLLAIGATLGELAGAELELLCAACGPLE
eukprot:jgi/Botrbrau1/9597/Bobra.106_2s0019.1